MAHAAADALQNDIGHGQSPFFCLSLQLAPRRRRKTRQARGAPQDGNAAGLWGCKRSAYSKPFFFSSVSSICCTAGLASTQRQADAAGFPAQAIHRPLDGDGVRLFEQRPHQAHGLQLQAQAFGMVAVKPQLADVVGHLGRHVGQHADHALAAQRQHRYDLIVVAGVDVQLVAAQLRDLGDLHDVAAGFLDAVDVGQLAQLGQRFRLDVHAGAGRHVVDDAGQADRIGNGGVVGDQPGLGGFVVVGGHQQQGVGAVGLRLLRQLDGIGGVVGAGAGHNRHATRPHGARCSGCTRCARRATGSRTRRWCRR